MRAKCAETSVSPFPETGIPSIVPGKSDEPADRRRRCRLAAPPLTSSEGEPEGAEILAELSPPAAVVLAGALRDLMLWLHRSPANEAVLFSPRAGATRERQFRDACLDEPLWAPVLTLELVTDPSADLNADRLRNACRRIAAWAEERGAPGTRLAFLQAEALLSPGDAALACEVGRLARDLGDHARAESWFRHAIKLARNRDWTSYVWAYVGIGVLYVRAGVFPAAYAVMQRALRSARRRHLPALAAVAHHHLFHLNTEAGRPSEAYQHARSALEAYGRRHPGLGGLAADVGRFWLHEGEFARALPLFEAAVPAIGDPNVRAMVAANAARAAAGAGALEAYERTRSRAVELIGAAVGRNRIEDAYEALAFADLHVGAWERAVAAAREALRLATATGNAEVRLTAESLLAQARTGQRHSDPQRPVESPRVAREANRLAGDFVLALTGD